MKNLFFGICFITIVFANSLALAQDAGNAGDVQGVMTPNSVVCSDLDKKNLYPTQLLDNGGPFADRRTKEQSLSTTDSKPSDATGVQ